MKYQLHFTYFCSGRKPKHFVRTVDVPDLAAACVAADTYRQEYRRRKGILASSIDAAGSAMVFWDNYVGEWMPVQY